MSVQPGIADLSGQEKRALLAELLRQQSDHRRQASLVCTPPAFAPLSYAPLSYAQGRLWLLQQLQGGQPVYNLAHAYRLRGRLDVAALERSLKTLAARHEVLRTTFTLLGEQPVQVVHPALDADLVVRDLQPAGGEPAEAAGTLAHALTAAARWTFTMERGPLWRPVLFRLGPEEQVLLLTVHHSITDGWSMGVLWRELCACYRAYAARATPALAPLPLQYADYARAQREQTGGEQAGLARAFAYWTEVLQGDIPVVALPTDHARPAQPSYRGAVARAQLSPELAEQLKELGKRTRATLFMTLLAGFQALLARYSGQTDVWVGIPVSNRPRTELQHLVGLFVNTLVIRTDVADSPSTEALIARVRQRVIEALAHQELPFEQLVELLAPERDLSRSPLIQVMFTLRNVPHADLDLPGIEAQKLDVHTETAKLDLWLGLTERASGLDCALEYNTDIFTAATAARLLRHYAVLLEAMVQRPQARLSELPLLTGAERSQLLAEWNATAADYPRGACIHELFEAQAERTPHAAALVFDGVTLTYAELQRRIHALARRLQRLGVGPDRLVGLYAERSLDLVVGLLAILKAGGAYVPLDPNYPSERLAFILEDARPAALLTQRALAGRLPPYAGRVLYLDAAADPPQPGPPRPDSGPEAAQNVTPEQLAYVIYTSGSTGRPKGVRIPHRAVVNMLTAMCARPGLTQQDVVLAITTLSFDIAVLELLAPLTVGARVVIASRATAADGTLLARAIVRAGATLMQATPATWRMLLEAGWTGRPGLRMLCGGEVLSLDLAQRLLQCGASLWNMYGPTETTVWSAVHQVQRGAVRVPLGRGIANTRLYVLDAQRQPVPVGVAGELYIGGDGVAKGYLNRPELTAERFVPDPFSPHSTASADPDARLYRTGDRVRWQADGTLEFLGRFDDQIKLRGHRIELGEIEAVLGRYPGLANAVVMVREDVPGDQRLAAYVAGAGLRAQELRRYLQDRLPGYMVPGAILIIETLPLTPNGKVDRKALAALKPCERAQDGAERTAPRDALELQLARAFEQVLGVASIGVRDNFFELGGHSLLAVALCTRIERAVGRPAALALIFQHPTVEKLALALREDRSHAVCRWLVPLQSGGTRPPFFCVHGAMEQLSRGIGPEQPFYGLAPHGIDGRRAPATVEAMAANYVREIRTLQPQGPYHIGGYSAGGVIAFEIAQQLRRQGQHIALLALLDPSSLSHMSKPPAKRRLRPRLRDPLRHLVCRCYLALDRPLPTRLRKFYHMRASRQANQRYLPQVYPGPVVMFYTGTPAYDPRLTWGAVAGGGIELHHIPGDYLTMIEEPHVAFLARQLRACLERAQAACRDEPLADQAVPGKLRHAG